MKLPALFTQVKWEIKHLRGANTKDCIIYNPFIQFSFFRGQFPHNAFTSENNTCSQFLWYDYAYCDQIANFLGYNKLVTHPMIYIVSLSVEINQYS